MRIDVASPSELSAADLDAWARYQAAGGFEQATPFLSPGWALASERALKGSKTPVKVAVVRDGDAARGFFAARVGKVTCMPPGAPLSDHQGFVGQRGLVVHPHVLLEALGVDRYDFCHMTSTDLIFGPYLSGAVESYAVDLSQGWDAYERGRKEAGTDILKD